MALDFSTYPPKAHQERINTYQRFERLFLGQHKQVFAVTPQPYQMKRYIAANFAGLISRLSADLLFGEEPDFIATQDDEAAKEALTQIVMRNAAAFAGQRARVAALIRQYQTILADLNDEAAAWIELNIPRAYGAGLEFVDGCIADYRRAGINLRPRGSGATGRTEREVFSQIHREAIRAVTESMLDLVSKAAQQIGRRVDDVFRREGIANCSRPRSMLTGSQTPRSCGPRSRRSCATRCNCA